MLRLRRHSARRGTVATVRLGVRCTVYGVQALGVQCTVLVRSLLCRQSTNIVQQPYRPTGVF